MRTLSSSLLDAQKAPARTPYVRVEARNFLCGAVNLKWERLYTGAEPDGPHALTAPSDGSLIRLRATPASDGRKLYRQRVAYPGPGSDFSLWTYLNRYDVMAAAACSLGAEVSLFWIRSDTGIGRSVSSDNGGSWPVTDYPGYAPTGTGVTGAAAAYKPNGDLALFFTDTDTLYVIERVSGAWQARAAWTGTAGSLSGAAAVYDGDWKILLTGTDSGGNYKIWSIIYGDGLEVAAGSWSDLKEIASAPSGGGYEYKGVYLDRPDTLPEEGQETGIYRCFFTEKYTGTEAYTRSFLSHTIPGTPFTDNRWREPVPFGGTEGSACDSGLAVAHTADYAWLSSPCGVWRAALAEEALDLSRDVAAASLKQEAGTGRLVIELSNDKGRYSTLPVPGSPLDIGCRIDFSPGYRIPAGNEYSPGLSFTLEAYEHRCRPGEAALVLYAADGWKALEKWTARYQLRWNRTPGEASIKEIIAQVLARAGIKLNIISESAAAGGFCPDFSVHPGDNGKETITRLLSFLPEVLFLEGNTAHMVDPLAADPAVYAYGTDHTIVEGRYRRGAWNTNRVRAEGAGVLTESFAWDEIQKQGDILRLAEDLNLNTAAAARDRGDAILRKSEIESAGGYLRAAVNCGQQLFDVIEITDPQAGLAASKRRVLGIGLSYLPSKAVYEQKLILGGV